MARRKIGILIAKADTYKNESMIQGITETAFCNDTDVFVIHSYLESIEQNLYMDGESCIFTMLDFGKLDGLILFPHELHYHIPGGRSVYEVLEERLRAQYHFPVISVNYNSEHFINVRGDDVHPMTALVHHLKMVHACTSIAFVTGPKGVDVSEHRIQAFRQAMENEGLTFQPEAVYYGEFWFGKGEDVASKLIESHTFPDAVVCACDPMAIDLMSALLNHGLRIPEDIIVTGFNYQHASAHITSISSDFYATGQQAAASLLRQLAVSEPLLPTHTYPVSALHLSESCGCGHDDDIDTHALKRNAVINDFRDQSERFFMSGNLGHQENMELFLRSTEWYLRFIKGFDRFHLCLLEDYYSNDYKADAISRPLRFQHTLITDNTDLPGEIHDEGDALFENANFPFELTAEFDRPTICYLNPLHSMDTCYGFTALCYEGEYQFCHYAYRSWMYTFGTAFAMVRRLLNEKRFMHEIIETQEQVTTSFAEIIESKSSDTGGHVKRVSLYTKLLAEELGYSPMECEQLRLASMLHDVGKLMIPANILEKPGKLTPEEFETIKLHVYYGADLLKNTKGAILQEARTIALEHHEHWDGHGYLGKKGDEISRSGQIVALADVYDALVSKRVYKEAWTEQRAYEEILCCNGTHFSPVVVEAFRRCYDKIRTVFLQNPD